MTAPPVQFVSQSRDDLRGSDAERDGVTAAEKLVGTVERHLSVALSFAAVMDDDSFRALSAMARAIEAISDYILTACPTCGARHLTQPDSAGSPDHPSGAATAEADVVSSPPATSAPIVPMPAEASDAMLEASWNSVRNVPAAERMACEFKTGREAHFHKQRHRYRAMVAAAQCDTAFDSSRAVLGEATDGK